MSLKFVPSPETPGQAPLSPRRRASVRYQCGPATPGKLYVGEKQEWQRAWVMDLSRGGMGLLVNRPLEVGKFIIIQMKSNDEKKVFDLSATVMHVTEKPSGDWVVGCEL